MTEPTVSVLLMTYNHAGLVGRAVGSALAQRTDFPFEIVITEDCSTDGTRELVEELAGQHPEKIRLLLSERNIASNEVVARGLQATRGRYVALLDGDDYWTDPAKLQRQVDILEADSTLSACFLNAYVGQGDAVTDRLWTAGDHPRRIDLERLLEGNPFATCAGLLRAKPVRNPPAWYSTFLLTDWPLYVLCAEAGDIAFDNHPVGVYRLHERATFTTMPTLARLDAIERFYRKVMDHSSPRVRAAASRGCAAYFLGWAEAYNASGEYALARSCLLRSARGGALGRSVSSRAFMKAALTAVIPSRRRP